MDVCPVCGHQNPPPNVRAANAPEEVGALGERLRCAEAEVDARSCRNVLDDFGKAVDASSAVVACSVPKIKEIVSGNALYNTYYGQVYSRSRIPEDNKFDKHRASVDSRFFPNYHDRIVFAALSLDGKGVNGYGRCFLVLKDYAVNERSSVFEMNTFTFAERHNLGLTQPVPPGYRAPWSARATLAKAKLHAKLSSTTRSAEYASTLLDSKGTADSADFIEVHIFGEFSRGAIEKVYFMETADEPDKIILRSVQQELGRLGIPCELI